MQLDRAGQRHAALGERQQGEGICGDIGFGDGDAAAIHRAVDDRRAIGILRPARARRHDIAMGVERDGRAGAEATAHHQIGDRDHAAGLHLGRRHRMALDGEAEAFEQRRGALGKRRAIARRIVRRAAHQLGEEGGLGLKAPRDGVVKAKARVAAHDGAPLPSARSGG